MATTKKTTAKKTTTSKKTTAKRTTITNNASLVETITPDLVGIGTGKIWNTLNESRKNINKKKLLNLSKLSRQSLYLGIGWLTCEGKLEFDGKEFELV